MAQQPRRLRIVTDSTRNPARSRRSNPSETDMAALVDRAADGEREAFDELVRLTHRDAFGLALRLTGNEEDARDVVQDAYLRAYRSIGRFRGDALQHLAVPHRCEYVVDAPHQAQSSSPRRIGRRHPDRRPTARYRPVVAAETGELRDELDTAIRELPPACGLSWCCATSMTSHTTRSPTSSASPSVPPRSACTVLAVAFASRCFPFRENPTGERSMPVDPTIDDPEQVTCSTNAPVHRRTCRR